MILLIDNYDSFTYNLYDYIRQSGLECILYRNDEITIHEIEKIDPAGFVFSPGPKRPQDHPLMFEILEKFYKTKPILGICLGYQAIGEFFGAKLIKAPVPAHGKVCEIFHEREGIFQGIPSPVAVTRYHSLILTDFIGSGLKITSQNKEGIAMSAAHKELPLWGVQFHPEAILTDYGLKMIQNWAQLVL
jgi:anthranilate synthase/aminodeoxychorismate synthase-like glutamine amidotransferase